MKVSYNWLQEYIEDKLPDVKIVTDALTMHSFEIEEIVEKNGDFVIDVKVLPNRSHDCLSHYGIASEICSVLNLKRKDLLTPAILNKTDKLRVNINTKNCNRQMFVLIEDVNVSESPEWLKNKLNILGSRSINSIVDITNYFTFAFGQPMHAFDASKVLINSKGQYEFNIREAIKDEKIVLLDGKEYVLNESVVVIADNEKPLDVAGVMGGRDSGVTKATKDIILSFSNFNPVSIRSTAKKLGIRTDASHRFENGISQVLIERVLPYVLKTVSETSGGKIVGVLDVSKNTEKQQKISVPVSKISSMLGLTVSPEESISLLQRQKIETIIKDDFLEVTVPLERIDLKIPEDVVEEIGRLFGYKNIAPSPLVLDSKLIINQDVYISDSIRNILGETGFTEIYSYAFSSKGEVLLENPLAGDKKFLRSNLLTGMEEALEKNFKYLDLLGIDEVKLFEIGKVFKVKGETLHLSLGVKFPKNKKINVDEEIARTIKLIEDKLDVSVGDVSIVGGVAEFDLERIKKELTSAEDYPADIWNIKNKNVTYKPISPFPFAVRDVAVFVPNEVSEEEVDNLIKVKLTDIVVRFSMFDKFTKEDKTSYAFRLVFQANDRTLTEDEINAVMNPIYEKLKSKEGFEIR